VRDRLDDLLPAPLADFAATETIEREPGVARRRNGLTRMARASSVLANADRRKAADWTKVHTAALRLSCRKSAREIVAMLDGANSEEK
jgi:hypothetical protein